MHKIQFRSSFKEYEDYNVSYYDLLKKTRCSWNLKIIATETCKA